MHHGCRARGLATPTMHDYAMGEKLKHPQSILLNQQTTLDPAPCIFEPVVKFASPSVKLRIVLVFVEVHACLFFMPLAATKEPGLCSESGDFYDLIGIDAM
eukprot:scaffold127158_cov22-Tisochrysis_lutea.AAC.1